jgi:predicted transcriptional regulator
MGLKNNIRMYLNEQDESWVSVSPEEYKDLLKYVNGDGSIINRLPDYKGKKIKIDGDLNLSYNGDVTNIDSIDYVDGNLDITKTNITYFDKNKVKGWFRYYSSRMEQIEKKKILDKKLKVLNGYRENGEWDVEDNDDEVSNETEALFLHLMDIGSVGEYENEEGETVPEDKYFIWTDSNHNYYEWLGDENGESEWMVIPDDKIDDVARQYLQDSIDDSGYDTFSPHVWENNLDTQEVERWLYDYFSDDIRNYLEGYDIPMGLSEQQENYVNIYTQKIEKLTRRLSDEDLTEDQIEEIKDEISNIEEIIEDIHDSPEGDYSEEAIEDEINARVSDNSSDFMDFLKNIGYDTKYFLEFVDVDGVIEDIINDDSYGSIINRYDGRDDEYKVNGKWYHVMRQN